MDQPPKDVMQQESGSFMEDDSARLAWIFQYDLWLTRAMGGLLPERDDELDDIHDILDIGCASGQWALSLAHLYPQKTVMAIDDDKELIKYARAHAKAQNIKNIHYQLFNFHEPLPFSDASFDMVNARSLALKAALKPEDWPILLQECWRILRPGGTLRLTELERNLTNSVAQERMWSLLTRSLFITGHSFSPDGCHFGFIPHFGRLMHNAGFLYIRNRTFTPELAPYMPDFSSWREIDMYGWMLSGPFFIQSGVITEEEFRVLQAEALRDCLSDDFCAIAFIFTCWSEKPR